MPIIYHIIGVKKYNLFYIDLKLIMYMLKTQNIILTVNFKTA